MNKPSTRHGHVSGVPHPIMEDTALKGDTRNILHHVPLPKKTGANNKTLEYTSSREPFEHEDAANPFRKSTPMVRGQYEAESE